MAKTSKTKKVITLAKEVKKYPPNLTPAERKTWDAEIEKAAARHLVRQENQLKNEQLGKLQLIAEHGTFDTYSSALDELVGKMGGSKGFAAFVWREMNLSKEGSQLRFKYLSMIKDWLKQQADFQRQTLRDNVAQMTEQELHEVIVAYAKKNALLEKADLNEGEGEQDKNWLPAANNKRLDQRHEEPEPEGESEYEDDPEFLEAIDDE